MKFPDVSELGAVSIEGKRYVAYLVAEGAAGTKQFDWDRAEPELIQAFTDTIADNPPDNAAMVTVEWAFEILTELSDRGYVLTPLASVEIGQ